MVCNLILAVTPVLNTISSGFKIIILTLLIAGAAAYLFPVKKNQRRNSMNNRIYLYILVMAGVTYLIRVLPLTSDKKRN